VECVARNTMPQFPVIFSKGTALVSFVLQSPVITTCTTKCNIKKLQVLLTEYIYVLCICLRRNTDSALYNINRLVFISWIKSVYCAVRIQSLTDYVSTLKC
jgi:hypothetical protein